MENFELKPGVVAFVVRDAVDYLEFAGILAVDGTFREPTVAEYTALADAILKSLADHQVEIPQTVEDAIRILKFVLPIVLQYVKTAPKQQ